jgi:hypothetical protein
MASIRLVNACIDMIERLGYRGAGLGRQEIAADLVHPLAGLGNPLNAFPRDDPEFRLLSRAVLIEAVRWRTNNERTLCSDSAPC